MATTHVFIVDATTFKYHLEYQFVGTGAKEHYIDFNAHPTSQLTPQSENNLVSMVADSQRLRANDYVIFYLQQNSSEKIYEGKFYGIFKIKDGIPFLDNYGPNQFLSDNLGKSLTFRALIEPCEVYADGVTEWEALDEIRHIQSPNQMLWSLIYRKLKGNRGNTMITIYESERLFKLLRDKNARQALSNLNYTFDRTRQEVKTDNSEHAYTGRKEKIDILPRLRQKYARRQVFETHLQAYIMQNIGRNTNQSLDGCLLNKLSLEWIGNEVSCGVGMQRMDIMLSATSNNNIRFAIPVELKASEATANNVHQIQRYVDWLEQYYIPNRVSDIQPCLISKEIADKNQPAYNTITSSFREFNKKNNRCLPLKYIEYKLVHDKLVFKEENY